MNPMLIDSHAHLTFKDYKDDFDGVIARAKEAGLGFVVNIGSGEGLSDNFDSLKLAKTCDWIFSTVGIHPHDATRFLSGEFGADAFEQIAALADDKKVVAVGEIGLDYHYIAKEKNFAKLKGDQIEVFKKFLDLAAQKKLPIIIHDRDAHEDTIFTLRRHNSLEFGGVMHCFSGDVALAREVLDLGMFISITGAVTFKKKSEILQEVVRFTPVEKLLIETDCPFISPEPHRGGRNEPAFVKYVAEKIASIKGLSVDDVARITSQNAMRLFHLPGEIPAAKIAYAIRDSLYLNITNRCTLACRFCPKHSGDFEVKGHNLKLAAEPSIEDVFRAIGDARNYKEVVFCGFGEATTRIELVKTIAKNLKEQGVLVRLDTDGLANLTHGRNIAKELEGLIDSISVSLNAPDAATYAKICPSKFGTKAFDAVCEFIIEAKKYIPNVTASVVTYPGVDVEAARKLAEEKLKVRFRARTYQEVG